MFLSSVSVAGLPLLSPVQHHCLPMIRFLFYPEDSHPHADAGGGEKSKKVDKNQKCQISKRYCEAESRVERAKQQLPTNTLQESSDADAAVSRSPPQ